MDCFREHISLQESIDQGIDRHIEPIRKLPRGERKSLHGRIKLLEAENQGLREAVKILVEMLEDR